MSSKVGRMGLENGFAIPEGPGCELNALGLGSKSEFTRARSGVLWLRAHRACVIAASAVAARTSSLENAACSLKKGECDLDEGKLSIDCIMGRSARAHFLYTTSTTTE
jgi:hypothetical protein